MPGMPSGPAGGPGGAPGGALPPLPPGLSVFDAEDDADLATIVARGRAAAGPVLWCGSGGLARALAGAATAEAGRALRGPVLGLFGSDQPATARQIAACAPNTIAVTGGDGASAADVARMLADETDVLERHIQGVAGHAAQVHEQVDLADRIELALDFVLDPAEIGKFEPREYPDDRQSAFMLDGDHAYSRIT